MIVPAAILFKKNFNFDSGKTDTQKLKKIFELFSFIVELFNIYKHVSAPWEKKKFLPKV